MGAKALRKALEIAFIDRVLEKARLFICIVEGFSHLFEISSHALSFIDSKKR